MNISVDPILTSLIAILAIAVVLFLVTWVWAIYAFSPESKRRRALFRHAHQEYQNARGSAHLQMLQKGLANLDARLNKFNDEITSCQKIMDTLPQEEKTRLLRTLETHIVANHMGEIPGIGQKLRENLTTYVFKGRLDDLRYASYHLRGIGESRQLSINIWIGFWEERIPTLLKEDFPGKKDVKKEIACRKTATETRLRELQAKKTRWTDILSRTETEIKKLSEVKEKHFRQALLEPKASYQAVDHYLEGAFPEWEPMPGWFKELVSEEAE